MTARDLKDLFEEFASHAPDISDLPTEDIIDQIRRRRQRNTAALSATAALGLLVTVGGVLAATHLTNQAGDLTSEPPTNAPSTAGITFGGCGTYLEGEPSAASALAVTFHGPDTTRPDEHGLVRFKVTVTNRGQAAVKGVGGETPEVFVTGNRKIVAMPLAMRGAGVPFDLAAGQAVDLHAAANLRPCNQAGSARSTLEPGTYQLFVRYVVNTLDANRQMTGESIEAQGGPWSITIT